MEENAIEDPQISLTPEAWIRAFGINNSIETPIGKVKMGENQYAKLQDKKRTSEFGMISLTLSDPDVVFIEPSEAKEREGTSRKFSYVFAKTFKHNGEKIKYYTSVTVSIDGMEISVSSHFVNPNKMLNKLVSFERAYTKEALFSNSSEKRLAEHQNDVPDLLPTQENNASSAGKDSERIAGKQESEQENDDVLYRDDEGGKGDDGGNMRAVAWATDRMLAVTTLPADTEVKVTEVGNTDMQYEDAVKAVRALPDTIQTADGYVLRVSRKTRNKLDNELLKHKKDKGVIKAFANLQNVVGNSLLIEEHRDRIKIGGERKTENPSDPNIEKTQRFYGAVLIDGTLYRVKTTAIVLKAGNNRMHGYEVTEIELLPSSIPTTSSQETAPSNNSITLANLLKDVEFSYEKGKKITDEMSKGVAKGTDRLERDSDEEVNEQFNLEVQRYANGEMDKNEILYLGNSTKSNANVLARPAYSKMCQRILAKRSIKNHNVVVS